jgi:GH25 family lysozyme M1 (1,4-beta-N-acetylmuramidase)
MYKYIDISTYQKNVDYLSVKNDGVKGVILRVGHTGYGNQSMYKDVEFERHYAGFTKVGVPVGVYWFSRANTKALALKEAQLTLEFIKGKNIQLPVYFDTEDTYYQAKISKQALTEVALTYLNKIKEAGYVAGVYASVSWLNNRLDMNKLQQFETWVAQYFTRCTYTKPYQMWQYSSSGRVKGISGNVDMNWAYKPYHELPIEKPIEVKPIPTKKYLNLSKLVTSWNVYPLNKDARVGNQIGKLAPKRFGGLKYEILEVLPNNVYVIETKSFGKVKIWAGKGALYTITES